MTEPLTGVAQNTPVPLVDLEHVTKRFPGVLALDDVHFTLSAGEVHALVGENGAGKSTLMKVLGGIYHPDAGTIAVNGHAVSISSPLVARELGISVIHQELNLMPDLSVAQNIFFGREGTGRLGLALPPRELRRRTRDLLARIGLDLEPDARVGSLPVAAQQMVEIAKALSVDSRVLVMDEPTAALTDREVEALFRVMNDFVTPSTGIVYISHRMEEIRRVADRITVMRDGQWVATRDVEDLPVGDVIELMVGRRIVSDTRPRPLPPDREAVLRVSGLSTRDLLRDVSFELHRGEVLGFAGLVGAGRTEVARALIGADPMDAGDVEVFGEPAHIRTPEDAVAHSIAYLSEDRKRFGLLLDKDLVENISLPSYRIWSRAWVIDDSRAEGTSASAVERLDVRTPGIHQLARYLSGGNQQKVVLAKWLVRDCDILIFDEPTRGIDVGAKEEIYGLLEDLASRGKSVIVISSEIPEVLRLAQRIVVMWQGKVTGVLDNASATQSAIMALATGQVVPTTEESA